MLGECKVLLGLLGRSSRHQAAVADEGRGRGGAAGGGTVTNYIPEAICVLNPGLQAKARRAPG